MRANKLTSISTMTLLLMCNKNATASQNININNSAVVKQKLDTSQIKVTSLENEVRELLNANKKLKEEVSTLKLSRDIARQESDNAKKELNQIKNVTLENQASVNSILNELQDTKNSLANAIATNQALMKFKSENEKTKSDSVKAGDLVMLTPKITPAKPINLKRMTPKVRNRHGVVVVNVLINENGEVLDAKLLQGLHGYDESDIAHTTCIEQAKRVIFDPARLLGGKIKVSVWQGVGFYLK